MFKFWIRNKNSENTQSEFTDPGAIKKVAISHAIDRRHHPRVKYPRVGYENLPYVVSAKGNVFPVDLSLGGMLLKDPPIKKPKIKGKYAFKMIFNEGKTELACEAELLRVRGGNWHFKWTKHDDRYVTEFASTFKAGLRGYNLRPFDTHEIPQGQEIVELWLSEQGDLVMFQQPDAAAPYKVTISCGGHRVLFDPSQGFLMGLGRTQTGDWNYSTLATASIHNDVAFMLSNIRQPTLKICKFLEDIEKLPVYKERAA